MCEGVYRTGEAQFTGIAEALTNLLTMGAKASLGRHFGSSEGHPTSSRRWGTGCMAMGGIHTGWIRVYVFGRHIFVCWGAAEKCGRVYSRVSTEGG